MLKTKGTELIQGDAMKFVDIMPGASKAEAWGDPYGDHGNFARLKAGFKSPMHTHTYDVKMVIVTGTLLHGDATGVITRLGPGSYCYIPEGQKHTTACAEGSDCLFYEEQPGKFDIKPAT